MSSKNEIKIVKEPIVRTGEQDFLEYAYRDRIVYCVRLSNGMVVTKPEDFPTDVEENKKSSLEEG